MRTIITFLSIVLATMSASLTTSFKEAQLAHSRVKTAYQEKQDDIKKLFAAKKLSFTGFNLFLRAFKKEQTLEVWVKDTSKHEYVLLHTYLFCSSSGTLGPKRKEGDLQIPEGVYYIQHFNPQSNFHLSLGLNYPNASDKILGHPTTPGSSIYIHGNCVTIGCIPITDDKIKELYILAVEARNNGQEKIPVHIFPDKLTNENIETLATAYAVREEVKTFWKNLQPVYQDFETTKKLKSVSVNSKGAYYFR